MGRVTRMRFSKCSGLLIMRPFWPQAERTEDFMFGIFPKSEKNKLLKMPRTVHQSCSSFMEDTRPKLATFHGIPMTPGSFALCLKTTSCKCGKWLKIFTTTKRSTRLHLRLKKITTWKLSLLCTDRSHFYFNNCIIDCNASSR